MEVIYEHRKKQPEWLDNAVFYEIYPQSFRDTNADGIGDFNGIIEKLDYIKELGCTALWLNPCFLSPFGDAGYDVEDYYTVAPRYGTNEDLVHLFEEAHERQMHVLLDLVPGGPRAQPQRPVRVLRQTTGGARPTGERSLFGFGN